MKAQIAGRNATHADQINEVVLAQVQSVLVPMMEAAFTPLVQKETEQLLGMESRIDAIAKVETS